MSRELILEASSDVIPLLFLPGKKWGGGGGEELSLAGWARAKLGLGINYIGSGQRTMSYPVSPSKAACIVVVVGGGGGSSNQLRKSPWGKVEIQSKTAPD